VNREQVIGWLADLTSGERHDVLHAANKIAWSREAEAKRAATRERLEPCAVALRERGVLVAGLSEGSQGTGQSYLAAIWPRGRRPHLLVWSETRGIQAACRSLASRTPPEGSQFVALPRLWSACPLCAPRASSGYTIRAPFSALVVGRVELSGPA
jgi:hypothetical protein